MAKKENRMLAAVQKKDPVDQFLNECAAKKESGRTKGVSMVITAEDEAAIQELSKIVSNATGSYNISKTSIFRSAIHYAMAHRNDPEFIQIFKQI